MKSASIRVLAAALVASSGAAAQSDSAEAGLDWAAFATADGSRFLLVPTGGPPVVHWATFTPAGVLEDPVGLEGLSYAVARAAMAGTVQIGSKDQRREQAALKALDEAEMALATARAQEARLDTELLDRYRLARLAAAAAADPIAWERELRAAPAMPSRLHQLPDGMLLHVATSVAGLGRVAALLYERREQPILRTLHDEFRSVRAELAEQRAATAIARGELLTLSFLGHPYSRGYIDTGRPVSLTRATALEVFGRTCFPARSMHVLTGGFETASVQALLERVFATTRLQRNAVPAPTVAAFPSTRLATIRGARQPAVTIGYQLGSHATDTALLIVVEWLAGSDDSELATRLRLAGHPDVTVRATAPFPGSAAEGLLVFEIESPEASKGPVAEKLLDDFDAVLARALADGPSAALLDDATARVDTQRRARRLGPERLALDLAIRCGLEGVAAETALAPIATPTAAAVLALAKELLHERRRTIVLQETDS